MVSRNKIAVNQVLTCLKSLILITWVSLKHSETAFRDITEENYEGWEDDHVLNGQRRTSTIFSNSCIEYIKNNYMRDQYDKQMTAGESRKF